MTALTALSDLPLFPLGTVLFPGGYLPLQIFEVRYLDMVKRCHANGTPFGIVSLTQGSEVRRRDSSAPTGDGFAHEKFESVGTLARIDRLDAPNPGLLVIQCRGMQRFRRQQTTQLKHGLWTAQVELLADDQPVPIPEDLQPVADALEAVLDTLKSRTVDISQLPLQPPYQFDNCAWVANRWCELLPMALAQRQNLMALDNPLLRLELVSDMLERDSEPPQA
ncbi:LON peptidase substrate-binding domain-containing protein [Rhodoferax aquaticus]|uniref:Peptidase S16 n=1 Tax=Rhodoferax aquaticus TaxID=2527691 RepID=A0A515EQV0_9BURK|nr:LON peptidase substrate-binding domain-containing protein [Rhodoferax aquaticus]QDL55020.1 peptidase S16 [Rhodoferax aquaticus]